VREEILDRLDVLARQCDQIARTASHKVGRCQCVELAVEIDAQLGEQAIGDVVRQPAFDPVQDAGQWRGERERDQEPREGRAGLDCRDGERAENADPDKECDAADAGGDDNREFPRPRLDDAGQAQQRLHGADSRRGRGRRSGRVAAEIACFAVLFCRGDRFGDIERHIILAALLSLRAHQAAIRAVASDQLGVSAALDNPALIEHQDAVGADDARQPVRQDQGRAALREAIDGLLDHRLVLGIDRRQGLVEDQDRRIAQQGARNRQPLPLPA